MTRLLPTVDAIGPVLLGSAFLAVALSGCVESRPNRSSPLPPPSGSLALGTLELSWADTSRDEVTTPDQTDRRVLVAQLWYPTNATGGARYAYVPASLRTSLHSVFGDSLAARVDGLDTEGRLGVPPRGSAGGYPLVVFLHGSGMSRHLYTGLVEDLASHGFVVAALDFPGAGYTVLPDGRVRTPFQGWQRPDSLTDADDIDRFFDPMNLYLTDDVSSLLSHLDALNGEADWLLNGVIDFGRVGVVGHSLGGLVSFRACTADARIRACVNLDGVSNYRERQRGLPKPAMLIRAGAGRADWFEALLTEPLRHGDSVRYDLLIERATHESFSDLPFLLPETYDADSSASMIHRVVTEHLAWFFGHTLRTENGARPPTPAGVALTEYGS